MALADILQRIEEDTTAEAAAIIEAAERSAAEVREDAQRRARAHVDAVLARTQAEAEAAARTRLATVRLAARDNMLAAKRQLVERVLADLVEHIERLPAPEYTAFIVRQIAEEGLAPEGSTLSIGHEDHGRFVTLLAPALASAGISARIRGTTGAIDRGVLIEGERVKVEVSARSLAASRREYLVRLISEALFGEDADDPQGPSAAEDGDEA